MDNGPRIYDYRKGCGVCLGQGMPRCSAPDWLCGDCERTKPQELRVQEQILKELKKINGS